MLSTVSVGCRFGTIDADNVLDWFAIWNSFASKTYIKCLIVKQALKEKGHNFVYQTVLYKPRSITISSNLLLEMLLKYLLLVRIIAVLIHI